jgi:low affinity Fe/Cu permease
MLVNLSRNSWHSKYYNFVKGYYPNYEFESLCPYFWTIVSLILLLPVILIWKGLKSLLKLSIKPIQKAIVYGVGKAVSEPYVKREPSNFSKWFKRNDNVINKWFGRIYFGSLMLMLLVVVVGGIIELFKQKGAWLGFVYIFACIGVTATCFLIIWLIVEFFSSDTWEMVKGMGYSVKNKVCPMIKWDEKNEH